MEEAQATPVQEPPLVLLSRLSAFSAVAVLTLYVIGFIVTSLHYATYGIPQANPFKTQVMAAGIWSVALLGGPIILAYRLRPSVTSLVGTLRASVENYIFVWILIAAGESAFSFEGTELFSSNLVIAPIVIVSALLLRRSKRWPGYYPWQVLAVASLLFASLVYVATKPLSAASIAFWLTIWGQFAIYIIKNINDTTTKESTFLVTLALFLAILSGFAVTLYPRIQYSWGGGQPIPILMRLSQASDILPGQELRTDLLEQTSDGYYVIDRANQKAVLIPPSAVSWVYYGDKPFDPKNLVK